LGHVETATILLEHLASLDAPDANGNTPLHLATQAGHVDLVNLLIKRGAKLSATTKEGQRALQVAYKSNQPKVIKVLEDAEDAESLSKAEAEKKNKEAALEELRAQSALPDEDVEMSSFWSAIQTAASICGPIEEVVEARKRRTGLVARRRDAVSKLHALVSQPVIEVDNEAASRVVTEAKSAGVNTTEVKAAEERLAFVQGVSIVWPRPHAASGPASSPLTCHVLASSSPVPCPHLSSERRASHSL